jgi:hypothetical protein
MAGSATVLSEFGSYPPACAAFIAATRSCIWRVEVRRDAEHALHSHELGAMVHLVLFRAEQHLEAGLARRDHALRERDAFGEEIFLEAFEDPRETLAFGAQQLQDLAPWTGAPSPRRRALTRRR